jgi:hypothetical protein
MSDLEQPMPEIQHLLSVIIMQNQRIYDTLLTILGHFDSELSYNLIAVHEQLENIGPVPYKVEDD